ncbi:MAG: SET domain-containing protein, partial [bacterium]|nr:SET domain-containing protein [bacterium]
MLLVKTSVGPSNISGLGLFADQFIEKGTIIWQLSEPLDLVLAKELVQNLPLLAKQTFLKHSYFSKKLEKYILSFDNDRFTNHSEDPNVLEGE